MKNEIQNDVPKKAVIYCRVSTKEQVDEGNSLVTQERHCREYAAKEGYEVVEAFIEKGESAKTADRKELQRLLTFCTAKKDTVQAVIAYKVDRISRNIADYSYIKIRLKKHNVIIKSVTEYFEDTPAGRFMENIISNVSQLDNEVRMERCVDGMKGAVEEGRYVWKAPLGYDNVRINNKATIAPNVYAPLVKEVFALIAQQCYPTDVIRLMMCKKGLVGKGGGPVNKAYFYRLIRNPVYKGQLRQFGITNKVVGYEPLVSEDLFDEVQAILKGRKNKTKHYVKENPDFPLRRFVVSEDGKPLTGYWSNKAAKRYPYYTFHTPGSTIRKEVLEEKFMALLEKYAFDTTHLNYLKQQLEKHFGAQQKNEAFANAAIEQRITEINTQIDVLINLRGQGSISEAIFTGRVSKFETELEELQGLLLAKNDQNINIPELLHFVADALKEPHCFWQKSPLEIRKKLQFLDFPNGIVFDGAIFRKPKICSIFKLKDIIDNGKSPKVDLSNNKSKIASTHSFPKKYTTQRHFGGK